MFWSLKYFLWDLFFDLHQLLDDYFFIRFVSRFCVLFELKHYWDETNINFLPELRMFEWVNPFKFDVLKFLYVIFRISAAEIFHEHLIKRVGLFDKFFELNVLRIYFFILRQNFCHFYWTIEETRAVSSSQLFIFQFLRFFWLNTLNSFFFDIQLRLTLGISI